MPRKKKASSDWVAKIVLRHKEAINRCGWAAQGVFAGEDGFPPGYLYTMGLSTSYGHPELCVSGLNQDVMHQLLTGAVEAIAQHKCRFVHGNTYSEVIRDYRAAALAVDPDVVSRYFLIAPRVLGKSPEYVQLVWPDAQRRYPWEPGYDSAQQTLFGNKPETDLVESSSIH